MSCHCEDLGINTCGDCGQVVANKVECKYCAELCYAKNCKKDHYAYVCPLCNESRRLET